MTEPKDAVWVKVNKRNPLSLQFPQTGWVTKEQWESKLGGMDLFRNVQVHFLNQTVKFPFIILREFKKKRAMKK